MDPVTVTVIVIIGTIAVIEAINLLMKIPGCDFPCGFTAVIVLNAEDNVELKIENVIHKLRWTDDELVRKIIFINNGLSDYQRELCRQYCLENSFLELAEPDNALKIILSSEKSNCISNQKIV